MSPIISRNTETITFSLLPPQAQCLRQAAREEERTVSELLREAIRLYIEEREWHVTERRQTKKQQFQPLTPTALYARVSSDRQGVDLSVADQLRALSYYAEKNCNSVACEYIDDAESGRVADGPSSRR